MLNELKVKKINVATLSEEMLDYWVAKADELIPYREDDRAKYWLVDLPNKPATIIGPAPKGIPSESRYSPSTNWSQGGPIIEEESICPHRTIVKWEASIDGVTLGEGETALIAAMRAYVTFKFGEEVDEV